MSFEANGTVGGIYVGYQTAAKLSAWEVRRREEFIGDAASVLTGRASDVDEFWFGQASRVGVRLDMGKCCWIWDTAEIQSEDPLIVLLDGEPRSISKE